MTKKLKIGLVQNNPITADLTLNLRQIVQGYRECLEHGADIVIASAHALCGAGVKDLAKRHSFLQQTEDAIETLAAELSNTPLILGAYTYPKSFIRIFEDDEDCNGETSIVHGTPEEGELVPFLLEDGLWAPNQGFLPKYTSGIHEAGEGKMIVSRGLSKGFPPRIFNRPELVIVHLVPEG